MTRDKVDDFMKEIDFPQFISERYNPAWMKHSHLIQPIDGKDKVMVVYEMEWEPNDYGREFVQDDFEDWIADVEMDGVLFVTTELSSGGLRFEFL